MSATERIKKYLKFKNITKYDFHKKMGLSNGFLDKDRAIGTDKCEIILEYYKDINPEWLITGKGDMLRGENPVSIGNKNTINTNKLNFDNDINSPKIKESLPRKIENNSTKIELYDFYNHKIENIRFNNLNSLKSIGSINFPKIINCDTGCLVYTDAMYPILKNGDVVLIKSISDLETIIFGEMYLLNIKLNDSNVIIIRYINQINANTNQLKLVSYNKKYDDIIVDKDKIESIAIIKANISFNSL